MILLNFRLSQSFNLPSITSPLVKFDVRSFKKSLQYTNVYFFFNFQFKTLGEKAARSREINLFVPFLRKQDSVSEPRTPTPLLQHDRTSFLRLESQKSECNGNYSFAKSTPSPLITNEIEGRDGLPVWITSAHAHCESSR